MFADAPESFYQQELAEQLGGVVEYQTPFGAIDVLTEDEVSLGDRLGLKLAEFAGDFLGDLGISSSQLEAA
ncbi:MAG: hypothetical protein HC769_23790 [Cyanobacteria bacterium CRU_2_1]|nr:hypothetical protein [Cyanobacteria bacterium CRU_2_1]